MKIEERLSSNEIVIHNKYFNNNNFNNNGLSHLLNYKWQIFLENF